MNFKTSSLASLSSLITKGTTPTTLGYAHSDSGIPFLRVQNIFSGQVNFKEDTLFIDSNTQTALKRSQIQGGDVLVTIAGTIGRTGVVPHDAPEMNCNQAVAIVRPTQEIERNYLRHWLESQDARSQMLGSTVTGTISNLSLSQLGELRVPLPPLEEQRRIAAILDQAETLRTQRRTALALLDSLTQSLFLDMFGDPLDNTKRWEWRCMSELFETSPIFGTMIPGEAERGSWLCLRVANIQDWQLTLEDKKYVDLPTSAVERHSVKAGDLLMARAIASQEHLGKCVVAQPGDELWAFDSHLMRLRFRADRAVPEFIRQLLRTPGGRNIFLKASRKSSVQYNINTKEISALEVPVPPLPLQQTFATRIASIQALKATHRRALAALDALFASLQQRAFAGQL